MAEHSADSDSDGGNEGILNASFGADFKDIFVPPEKLRSLGSKVEDGSSASGREKASSSTSTDPGGELGGITTTPELARSLYGDLLSPTQQDQGSSGQKEAAEESPPISDEAAGAKEQQTSKDQQLHEPGSPPAPSPPRNQQVSPTRQDANYSPSPTASPPLGPPLSSPGGSSKPFSPHSGRPKPVSIDTATVQSSSKNSSMPPSPKHASLSGSNWNLPKIPGLLPPGARTPREGESRKAVPLPAAQQQSDLALPPPTPSPSAKRKRRRPRGEENAGGEDGSSSPASSSLSMSQTTYGTSTLGHSFSSLNRGGQGESMYQRAQRERERLRKLKSGVGGKKTSSLQPTSKGGKKQQEKETPETTTSYVAATPQAQVVEHFQMASDDEDDVDVLPSPTAPQRNSVAKIRELYEQKSGGGSSQPSSSKGSTDAPTTVIKPLSTSKDLLATNGTADDATPMVTPRSVASSARSTPQVVLRRGRVMSGTTSPMTPTSSTALRDFQKFRAEELSKLADAGKKLAEYQRSRTGPTANSDEQPDHDDSHLREDDEGTEDGLSDVFDENLESELGQLREKYKANKSTAQDAHGNAAHKNKNNTATSKGGSPSTDRREFAMTPEDDGSPPFSPIDGDAETNSSKPRRKSFDPTAAFGTLESLRKSDRVPRFGQSPDTSGIQSPIDPREGASPQSSASGAEKALSPLSGPDINYLRHVGDPAVAASSRMNTASSSSTGPITTETDPAKAKGFVPPPRPPPISGRDRILNGATSGTGTPSIGAGPSSSLLDYQYGGSSSSTTRQVLSGQAIGSFASPGSSTFQSPSHVSVTSNSPSPTIGARMNNRSEHLAPGQDALARRPHPAQQSDSNAVRHNDPYAAGQHHNYPYTGGDPAYTYNAGQNVQIDPATHASHHLPVNSINNAASTSPVSPGTTQQPSYIIPQNLPPSSYTTPQHGATQNPRTSYNTLQQGLEQSTSSNEDLLPAHPAAGNDEYFNSVVQHNRLSGMTPEQQQAYLQNTQQQQEQDQNTGRLPSALHPPNAAASPFDQQQHGLAPQSPGQLPEWQGWIVTHDGQGALFFYHGERQESTWHQPPELADLLGTWEFVAQGDGPDAAGFWRNERLKLSLWSDPRVCSTVFKAALDGNLAYLQLYTHFCADALDVRDNSAAAGATNQAPAAAPLARGAVHFAVAGGYNQALEMLLFARADVNLQDGEGATPLHYACRYGYSACVQTLLDSGADWTLRKFGAQQVLPTVLHEACGLGQLDAVACLIYFQCDTSLHSEENGEGLTPLQVASRLGYHEIVRLLAHNLDANAQNIEDSSSDDSDSDQPVLRVEEEQDEGPLLDDEEDEEDSLAGQASQRPLTSTLTSLMRTVHKTVSQLYPQEAALPGDDGKLRYDAQRKEWVLIS
ncbi:unnamed protein product [Amoebophrya sp. A25]|nr:unnamed protein product [Amoebophrya sp. A25]|eukprot:GSA25T00022818001.1